MGTVRFLWHDMWQRLGPDIWSRILFEPSWDCMVNILKEFIWQQTKLFKRLSKHVKFDKSAMPTRTMRPYPQPATFPRARRGGRGIPLFMYSCIQRGWGRSLPRFIVCPVKQDEQRGDCRSCPSRSQLLQREIKLLTMSLLANYFHGLAYIILATLSIGAIHNADRSSQCRRFRTF